MENPTAATTLLMQIRALGVRVSLDDFGTGHSSLAYLRQLPVDALKIDQSFVRGIESNDDMTGIFGIVTTTAQQLGLSVVAEGIENEDQLALIRTLRCEFGQGYLLSRPVDCEAASQILKTGLPPRKGRAAENRAATLRPGRAEEKPVGVTARLSTARPLYIAAAVLTVMVSIGFASRLAREPQTEARPVMLQAQTVAPTATVVAPSAAVAPPAPVVAPPDSTVARPAPSAAPAVRAVAQPTRREPVTGTPAPATVQPVVSETSFAAVHQHRFGSCRGTLVVSRDGVAFLPDEGKEKGDDAFSFSHSEFLYGLEDGTLTITSRDRTYRFKAADKDDNEDKLQQLANSLGLLR